MQVMFKLQKRGMQVMFKLQKRGMQVSNWRLVFQEKYSSISLRQPSTMYWYGISDLKTLCLKKMFRGCAPNSAAKTRTKNEMMNT
jgi:hypothetical protein